MSLTTSGLNDSLSPLHYGVYNTSLKIHPTSVKHNQEFEPENRQHKEFSISWQRIWNFFANQSSFIIETRLTSNKYAQRGEIKQQLRTTLHNSQTKRLIVRWRKLIVRGEKQNARNKPQTKSNKRKTGPELSTSIEPQVKNIPQCTKNLYYTVPETKDAHRLTQEVQSQNSKDASAKGKPPHVWKTICSLERLFVTRWQRGLCNTWRDAFKLTLQQNITSCRLKRKTASHVLCRWLSSHTLQIAWWTIRSLNAWLFWRMSKQMFFPKHLCRRQARTPNFFDNKGSSLKNITIFFLESNTI